MKIGRGAVTLVVSLLLAIPCYAEDPVPAQSEKHPRVEVSLRSWMFTTGETKWSHDASGLDSRLGNPTSKLTYKDNNTHIMELSAKIHFARRWFASGDIGFSVDFDRGTLIDDDYLAGQYLFSRTSSSITGTGTWYVNANVGYRAVEFPHGRGHLDVLGGVQYWRTTYEATGFERIVCDPMVTPCTPPRSSALAITNTTHWITPLHVGIDTEYRLTRQLSADVKLTVSPVSILYNEDVHHLRSDLQQNPSFSMWGVGVSANAEASLKIMLSRHMALTGGYRIWWNRTYTGTWENHPISAPSDTVPLTEFQTFRHGATVGLTGFF